MAYRVAHTDQIRDEEEDVLVCLVVGDDSCGRFRLAIALVDPPVCGHGCCLWGVLTVDGLASLPIEGEADKCWTEAGVFQ